jgi:hypothetical protein
LGGFVSNRQLFYGQKISAMHIFFVALLEDPKTLPFHVQFSLGGKDLRILPFSCDYKSCCKGFVARQNRIAAFVA